MASTDSPPPTPIDQESVGENVLRMNTEEIVGLTRLLDNEIRIMKSEVMRISHELQTQKDKIRENTEKIKLNKTLPYLVSNVIEVCRSCQCVCVWGQNVVSCCLPD